MEEVRLIFDDLWARLSRPQISDKDISEYDRRLIEAWYEPICRRTFSRTSCHECYIDALRQIIFNLQKKDFVMVVCNYKLKNGVILQSANDPNVYTNANLTDDVAQRYLKEYPSRIQHFAEYPEDWNTEPAPQIEPNIDTEPAPQYKGLAERSRRSDK